ncbi:MAG: hypothetical protein PHE25_03770 [Candidatus Gracilibacteria bacterium]|nr:hypothetical protein [Candidatus Gracilibacteria bacterium]
MLKKILLISILFLLFWFCEFITFGANGINDTQTQLLQTIGSMTPAQQTQLMGTQISTPNGNGTISVGDALNNGYLTDGITGPSTIAAISAANGIVGNSNGNGIGDIGSPDFTIDTELFSIGGQGLKGSDAKTTINNTLGTIIQKLMIALGVIALLVMTIGAGYMILYHGEDEYLSKGKNIFIGGITALIVALSSYYIVNIIGYILYK